MLTITYEQNWVCVLGLLSLSAHFQTPNISHLSERSLPHSLPCDCGLFGSWWSAYYRYKYKQLGVVCAGQAQYMVFVHNGFIVRVRVAKN